MSSLVFTKKKKTCLTKKVKSRPVVTGYDKSESDSDESDVSGDIDIFNEKISKKKKNTVETDKLRVDESDSSESSSSDDKIEILQKRKIGKSKQEVFKNMSMENPSSGSEESDSDDSEMEEINVFRKKVTCLKPQPSKKAVKRLSAEVSSEPEESDDSDSQTINVSRKCASKKEQTNIEPVNDSSDGQSSEDPGESESSDPESDKIKIFKKKVVKDSRKQTQTKALKTPPVNSSDSDDSEDSDLSADDQTISQRYSQVQSSDDSDSDFDEPSSDEIKFKSKNIKQSSHDNHLEKVKNLSKKKDLKRRVSSSESDSEPEEMTLKETKMKRFNEDEEDEEYTAIQEELSHMTFEELQKLRDRLGIKVYNQVIRGGKHKKQISDRRTFSRENKNRPMETSSKRPVSVYREVVPVKKKVIRDPRFDDLSGNFNESIFRSSYAFVDKIKEKEKEKLARKLKKTKNEEKKQELQFLVNRMAQQESAEQQKRRRKELEKEWKKKEQQQVQQGKNPYFLKKGDLRTLELAERFKELKKTGKLDTYLGKKRKKNASREKKKLPDA